MESWLYVWGRGLWNASAEALAKLLEFRLGEVESKNVALSFPFTKYNLP